MNEANEFRTERRPRWPALAGALLGLALLSFPTSAAADFRLPVDDPCLTCGGGGGGSKAQLLDDREDAATVRVDDLEAGSRLLPLDSAGRRITALGGGEFRVPVEDRRGGWFWLLRRARHLYEVISL